MSMTYIVIILLNLSQLFLFWITSLYLNLVYVSSCGLEDLVELLAASRLHSGYIHTLPLINMLFLVAFIFYFTFWRAVKYIFTL